jgi:hypothetical protein
MYIVLGYHACMHKEKINRILLVSTVDQTCYIGFTLVGLMPVTCNSHRGSQVVNIAIPMKCACLGGVKSSQEETSDTGFRPIDRASNVLHRFYPCWAYACNSHRGSQVANIAFPMKCACLGGVKSSQEETSDTGFRPIDRASNVLHRFYPCWAYACNM